MDFYTMFDTRWHVNPQKTPKEQRKLDNHKREFFTFFGLNSSICYK